MENQKIFYLKIADSIAMQNLCYVKNLDFLCLQRDLTPPYVDDGLLEVVGFRDAWHGLVLLSPKGHGTRLAQVR